MTLNDVTRELRSSAGFRRQTECARTPAQAGTFAVMQVFYFGGDGPSVTGVVVLRAEGSPGNERVTFIGSLDNEGLASLRNCREM
jgi:hypothetical protein